MGPSLVGGEAGWRRWSEVAPGWHRHYATIRAMLAPVTHTLIQESGIKPGAAVLDVAGGAGDPSLAIAGAIGPDGRVTCTDAVEEMVAAARSVADSRGIANISFRRCAAESLPFATGSFDAVVCRFGAMFFTDTVLALSEMLRVGRSGARISLAVWAERERNPFLRIAGEVLARRCALQADPQAPDAFRYAAPGMLAQLLALAGARDVKTRPVAFRLRAPIAREEFWSLRLAMSETLSAQAARLSDDERSEVAGEVAEVATRYFPGGRMDFPAQALVVTGST